MGIKVYDAPIFETRPPHRTCPRLFSKAFAMWVSLAINPPVTAIGTNHSKALCRFICEGLVKISF